MLNRRILRIKAFKTIYSLAENRSMSVADALKELDASCEATRDLYLFLLDVVPALTVEARTRIEAARAKFHPTEEELHPNMKFAENRVAKILSQDPDFLKQTEKRKLSWDQFDVLLRSLYDSIRTKEYYEKYMNSGEDSLKEDAALWRHIFEEEFEDNEELWKILEDLSIWWTDDVAYALTYCCHAMDDLGAGKPWRLPELYLSQMPGREGMESDKDFVRSIVRRAVQDFEKDFEVVASLTPKWDADRLCTTDIALIVCGMAESASFPAVSPKIIINEYVEISKYYSTPDSRAFVNGLLNKLIINNA